MVNSAKGQSDTVPEAPWNAEQSGSSLAAGGVFLALGRVVVLPVGLISAAFLARALGPADFGLFSVMLSVIVWAHMTISMLFNRASVVLIAGSYEWESVAIPLIQIQLLLGTLAGAAVFLVAPALAYGLGEPKANAAIRLLALAIPVATLAQAYKNTLDARRAFRRSAFFPVVYEVSRLLLILVLVGMGMGLTGAALALLGAACAQLLFALRSVRLRFWRRMPSPGKQFLLYSLPLFLDALAKRLLQRLDLLVVQILAGSTSAGYYSAAISVNSIRSVFTEPLSRMTLATVSNSWAQGEKDEARGFIRQSLRLTLWMLPFAALGAGAAPALVTLVFGDAYLPAAPMLAWLSFALVGLVITSLTAAIFAAVGRPGAALVYNAPMLVLAVVGYALLVPRLGAVGVAVTNALTAWGVALATMISVRRWCQAGPGFGTVIRISVTSAIAYALASSWHAPGVWVIPQLIVLCGVVLLLLFALRELTASDLRFGLSLVRHIRGEEDLGEIAIV